MAEVHHTNIPWKWIIIGFLAICAVFAFMKVFHAIGDVATEFIKALGDVAKDGAKLVGECTAQIDCTKYDCSQCKSDQGCNCGSDQKCVITSGKKVGDSSPFRCLLGVLTFAWLLAPVALALVGLIAKAFGNRKAKPEIDAAAKDLKTTPEDLSKDAMDKASADVSETKDKFEKEAKKPMSPEAESALRTVEIHTQVADISLRAAATLPSEQKQVAIENARQNFDDAMRVVDAEKEKLSIEEQRRISDSQDSAQKEIDEKSRSVDI